MLSRELSSADQEPSAAADRAADGAAALDEPVGAFGKVIDLTHPLTPEFPTYSGMQFSLKALADYSPDGYRSFAWNFDEHTGTHIDAPLHFNPEGVSVADIPIERLVLPLAVVDLCSEARSNPDVRLTPDHLMEWERRYGLLPMGGCVAMNSGWDSRTSGPEFLGADPAGSLHFPGFHAETAAFLLEERSIAGIVVDTLSLDHGPSTDFPVHRRWLGAGRWGIECAANLRNLPARGATLIAGTPKAQGASGAPIRLLALL